MIIWNCYVLLILAVRLVMVLHLVPHDEIFLGLVKQQLNEALGSSTQNLVPLLIFKILFSSTQFIVMSS